MSGVKLETWSRCRSNVDITSRLTQDLDSHGLNRSGLTNGSDRLWRRQLVCSRDYLEIGYKVVGFLHRCHNVQILEVLVQTKDASCCLGREEQSFSKMIIAPQELSSTR